MEASDASNQLLKNKYNLHASSEVKASAKRTLARTGERTPQDPLASIQNYLSRFHEITDRKNPEDRKHGVDAFKRLLYSECVIKPNEIPEGYFENQRRIAREQGHGDIEITPTVRKQLADVIVTDQQSSLDNWVDYLASPDAPYSDALKYFALRSVVGMGEYDKEKHSFTQRSMGTVKPFPDLNREALAYVLDTVDKKYNGQNIDNEILNEYDKREFEKLVQTDSFPKLYAWAIDKVTPASIESLTNTTGEWIKYDQNTDATPLVASLQGHGTGWCTAGKSTATAQLEQGDFYVFYSNDFEGKPTVPRVAIRMQGDSIAEVRGIASDQNLDPYIGDVVEKKLEDFHDGNLYKKKAADMKILTEIEAKNNAGLELTQNELSFLYETDSPIEGFGYVKDPRISEIRSSRNPEADMLIIFECQPSQIAHEVAEIDESTKAYIGPLVLGIFDKISSYNVENVFTAFPEGKIGFEKISIGGKTKEELRNELEKNNVAFEDYTASLMDSPDFTTLPTNIELDLVRLTVDDIDPGIHAPTPTTAQLLTKAQSLGLELCPAEVGPHMRLAKISSPKNGYLEIGMKPINGPDGKPHIFRLSGMDWFSASEIQPNYRWYTDDEFVFVFPKSNKIES